MGYGYNKIRRKVVEHIDSRKDYKDSGVYNKYEISVHPISCYISLIILGVYVSEIRVYN